MKKRQIIVKRWNRTTEDLDDVVKSEEEIERLRAGLKDIDKNLGAYPYESLKKWVGLTQHISQSVLESLEPVSKNICSRSQIESEETRSVRDEGTLTSECGSSLLPTAHASSSSSVQSDVTVQESQLRLSRVPDRKFPADATPEEVTRHSMDHSYALSCMMRDYYGNDIKNLLGELQFCFVCFLIGHVYSAFEQWKCLIHLLCSCDEAITTNPDLFMKLINTLHFQINEIPEDFFVDIVSRTNFLTTTLQMFFSTLEESTTVDSQLRKRGLQFRKHLTKKFKWDFTQPPDDCQPVIVDV
ncbi:protein AAR2 homolog isoform X2 [Corticium candelabrum]|nr:protein AAR2 homolog isoform X2 [Corticium candelabrum]